MSNHSGIDILTAHQDTVHNVDNDQRKLVFLCLPGWRTSATLLKRQLEISGMEKLLDEYAELIVLDPLHPADGDPDPSVLRLNIPGPYFQWLIYRDPEGTTEDGKTAEEKKSLDWVTRETEMAKFTGVTESLQYLRDQIERALLTHRRFDGLLGFSQGSFFAMVSVIYHLTGAVALPTLPKMLILVSGFMPDIEMSDTWERQLPLRIPSLHITGVGDSMHGCSLQTAKKLFLNPVIAIHSQGHVVPRLDREPQELTSTIHLFLKTMTASVCQRNTGVPDDIDCLSRCYN